MLGEMNYLGLGKLHSLTLRLGKMNYLILERYIHIFTFFLQNIFTEYNTQNILDLYTFHHSSSRFRYRNPFINRELVNTVCILNTSSGSCVALTVETR